MLLVTMKSVLLTSFVALASGAANRTHYGDPNTHLLAPCLPDEVKAQITGLAGKEKHNPPPPIFHHLSLSSGGD
jgi:hypothetical protein